ncbi:MAG TPA: DUF3017 domain-containing protein [Mycobacteriales bacterium]|nr:DUF3017 domain-containing protein [Mycobacteriales bacterium]
MPPTRPTPRDWLRTRDLHNLPVLLVLACAAGGLGYSAAVPEHWRRGVLVMASAMIMAGFFRLVLPARQSGLLTVRSRVADVLCYAGVGAAIWLIALALPAVGP